MKRYPLTITLLLLNTIMFCITLYIGLTYETFISLGGLSSSLILDGEIWRLITYGFLHSSWSHFIGNIVCGTILIGILENVIGSRKALLIYTIGILVGGLFVITQPNLTVGSSSGIFGIMGALAVMKFNKRTSIIIKLILLISVINTFLASGISIQGHIGGLIGGMLVMTLIILEIKGGIKWQLRLSRRKQIIS